jgi:hypothetical protein
VCSLLILVEDFKVTYPLLDQAECDSGAAAGGDEHEPVDR